MPSLSIITPWYGPNSVALMADYYAAVQGAQVITVDNASEHAIAQQLSAMTTELGGEYIRNNTNVGFAAANNQGYARATGDIVIFLNSDIAAPAGWLNAVAADVQPGALYGPSLAQQLIYGMWLPYLEGWCIAATRETWDGLRPRLEDWTAAKARGEWGHIQQHLAENGAKGKRPIVQRGPWDAELFENPYWEDNYLCFEAMDKGVSLIHTAWPVQHKGGASAGALIKHGASFERNRATFAERVRPMWEAAQCT
jgi:glycosyltransferase involved in cell wall biosynthesis